MGIHSFANDKRNMLTFCLGAEFTVELVSRLDQVIRRLGKQRQRPKHQTSRTPDRCGSRMKPCRLRMSSQDEHLNDGTQQSACSAHGAGCILATL
jgi:hypothetical protein